jgi:hypothetical protein
MNQIPFFILVAAAASTPALAADTPVDSGGLTVLIQVRASDGKDENPPPLEVVLTLIAPNGCAEARESRPDAEYEFKVCNEQRAGALAFQLERTRRLTNGSEKRQFKVKATLAPGKPLVIARFLEGAREMEVKATMKKT